MSFSSVKKSLMLSSIFLSVNIYAASGGLQKTKKFLDNLAQGLHYLAIATAIIATMIIGYRVLFNGEALRDCKNIIIGAALIGGASEIIGYLLE